MGKIYLTGDTHGDVRRLAKSKFPEGENLTKDDIVIVLGDFGLVWDNSDQEKYWLDWLGNKPWTTMFIDGNHENFDILYSYNIRQHNGNNLRMIRDSVFHIPRGEILHLGTKRLLCFGGAESIDKYIRTEGKDWWSQEMPALREMKRVFDKDICPVDYVLTHTCPLTILKDFVHPRNMVYPLEKFFDIIKEDTKGDWYFGHYHLNKSVGRFHCLYDNIILLDEY